VSPRGDDEKETEREVGTSPPAQDVTGPTQAVEPSPPSSSPPVSTKTQGLVLVLPQTNGASAARHASQVLPASISDTLSTLSDRGLRRLLGARTFLRGLDYARRKVVEEITIEHTAAHGRVKGSDTDPYIVKVELTPEGIQSHCS